MPGIVGLQTTLPRAWAEPQLKRMVETLRHEQFYVAGTWFDERVGIYIGWVSRNDSSASRMPLTGNRRDQTLFLSGEDFSEPGQEGGSSVQRPREEPAMPSRLAKLSENDPGFPASLNGRFHGILVDSRAGTATLFNDRYGMHRVYYHQSGEAFYFAAEAKAILAVRPELKRITPKALGEFITCGCVLENRTLFEGIHVLPGAARWVIRDGCVENRGQYFEAKEWEGQDTLDAETYYQELRDVFSQRLPLYFASTDRIGVSLTGGLDTRMILAWQKPPAGSLPCYTFGGPYRECRDVIVGRKVAHSCGQPFQEIKVGNDFLFRFDHYAERTVYLTDGCADVRRAVDLYLNERVRQIAPVRITGNYGSEVLRGVRAFKPSQPLAGLFSEDMLPHVRRAGATYRSLLAAHPLSFAVFKQAPWHHYGLLALEESQVSLRSPYLDNELVRTVFRAPRSAFAGYDVCLRLIEEGDPALRRIPTDRGVGIPGLVGVVSRKVHEFSTKAEYAYDYGMPQWLARVDHRLSFLHLERLILGRHKFSHYRVWYRDTLAGYVREVLLDSRALSRPYIQRSMVESVVSGHLSGAHNYTSEIHTLLTLELLHRLFLDHN